MIRQCKVEVSYFFQRKGKLPQLGFEPATYHADALH